MATIKDVAKLANVSVATVSRVLNGSAKVSKTAKDAVLQAREELGFVLNANARALAHQNSEIIGAVVSDVSDPYFGTMAKAIEKTAHNLNAKLLIAQGFHDKQRERQAIENLLSYKCRAYIVHALAMSDHEITHYLNLVPAMVLINRKVTGYEHRCINIDNKYGTYLATLELIKHGHHNIAYVGSSHNILDAKERLAGFNQALKDNNIKLNKEFVFKDEPSLEGGERVALKLLDIVNKITAIVTYNDTQAVSIISVLTQHGINIPNDISIVGFDNLYMSRFLNPPLSTVINPVESMAHEALMLSLSISKNEHYLPSNFEVSFVARNSIKTLN